MSWPTGPMNRYPNYRIWKPIPNTDVHTVHRSYDVLPAIIQDGWVIQSLFPYSTYRLVRGKDLVPVMHRDASMIEEGAARFERAAT